MVSGSCHRNREGFAAITDLQSPQSPIYEVRVDFKSTFRPTFRVPLRSDEAVRAPSLSVEVMGFPHKCKQLSLKRISYSPFSFTPKFYAYYSIIVPSPSDLRL
jgi:hypothetical protein